MSKLSSRNGSLVDIRMASGTECFGHDNVHCSVGFVVFDGVDRGAVSIDRVGRNCRNATNEETPSLFVRGGKRIEHAPHCLEAVFYL